MLSERNRTLLLITGLCLVLSGCGDTVDDGDGKEFNFETSVSAGAEGFDTCDSETCSVQE